MKSLSTLTASSADSFGTGFDGYLIRFQKNGGCLLRDSPLF